MKQLELVNNSAGGLDLIVERDAGNPVRVLTGKRSREFFEELKAHCEEALQILDPDEDDLPAEKEFKVVWDIELIATSPLAAAKEAQKWLQSKGRDWSFYVQERGDNDKPIYSVDLAEPDENAVLKVSREDYKPMIE